jgi:hypothetical protein
MKCTCAGVLLLRAVCFLHQVAFARRAAHQEHQVRHSPLLCSRSFLTQGHPSNFHTASPGTCNSSTHSALPEVTCSKSNLYRYMHESLNLKLNWCGYMYALHGCALVGGTSPVATVVGSMPGWKEKNNKKWWGCAGVTTASSRRWWRCSSSRASAASRPASLRMRQSMQLQNSLTSSPTSCCVVCVVACKPRPRFR